MERNNQLPEKWYIKGCEELSSYFKDNEISLDGDLYDCTYYIKENGNWDYFIGIPNHPYQEITLQQYLDSIKPNNNNKMKTIEIPEGYNINLEKLIELGIVTKSIPEKETKKIAETYDEIVESELPYLRSTRTFSVHKDYLDNLNAFIRLLNTATYLNKTYEGNTIASWYFSIVNDNLEISNADNLNVYDSSIYFNSKQAIEKALDILGEETIKFALKFN